MAGGQLI